MDFVKKAAASATGHSGQSQPQSQSQSQGSNAQGEKKDYVDMAFGMGAQKSGHNIDPNTQEKMTDAGRTAYEKATGSKVDPKISN
ncbi:hypothetical protein E4U41_002815 [Claviceps citrina]|nr:hypothetical protein E4U41_002815 [Claviceps citrina]